MPEGGARVSTFTVLAKYQEFVVNFGRERAAGPTSVDQEVVQVELQPTLVVPQAGEGIRNSWKCLKEGPWLNLHRQACCPLRRRGQLLV